MGYLFVILLALFATSGANVVVKNDGGVLEVDFHLSVSGLGCPQKDNSCNATTVNPDGNATTTTPPSPTIECLANWITYKENCYLLQEAVPLEELIKESSETTCYTLGAALVSIHSPEENQFLTESVKPAECGPVMIGLDNGIDYSWSDGSKVNYMNLTSTQKSPTVFMLIPSCQADATVGGWIPRGNIKIKSFVCKKTASSPNVPLKDRIEALAQKIKEKEDPQTI